MPRANRLTFYAGAAVESALLAVAVVWGLISGKPVLGNLQWNVRDLLLGLAGVIPPMALFLWTLRSPLPQLARHRESMEALLRPLFQDWTLLQLGTISLLAGLCEEALFRAALQGSLEDVAGPYPALVLASAIFGAAHRVTRTYAVLAGMIGLYLGALWIWTGNLLVPAVVHAVYDFIALMVFLRMTSRGPSPTP